VEIKMPISLPSELEQFAQYQIDRGNYESIEAMLIAGLKLLAEKDDLYQSRIVELRREVRIGVEAADRGELLDFDVEIGNIRQRIHDRHANK
jgi:antitoxin ParD1/3/4